MFSLTNSGPSKSSISFLVDLRTTSVYAKSSSISFSINYNIIC